MLHNADAFEVMSSLADNSIDAVITDPPYGTTSSKWDSVVDLDEFWKHTKRVLRSPHSPVVVFCDQPFTSTLVLSNPSWWRHEWIWDKARQSNAYNAYKAPLKRTEDIEVFSKASPLYVVDAVLEPLDAPITRNRLSYRHTTETEEVIEEGGTFTQTHTGFPKEVITGFPPVRAKRGQTKHPSQKPVELMEYLIKLYSREGDTILDPFMGSGTTGVACRNLNREFVGVEKDSDYYEVAMSRVA